MIADLFFLAVIAAAFTLFMAFGDKVMDAVMDRSARKAAKEHKKRREYRAQRITQTQVRRYPDKYYKEI